MSIAVFSIWLDAIRPRTLPLAFVSIFLGAGLAAHQQQFSLTIFSLAFVTALLLQILSNLANDYGDNIKGTDNAERIGPSRAMQQGLISVQNMQRALGFNIALIAVVGTTLLFFSLKNPHDFVYFIALGLLAILAALFYTIGDKPYGYLGLGDLSVLLFFGWIAVLGSYYLFTGQINPILLLPATGCGLLCVAVLNINNLRDIDNDKNCNKLTLVVRIGMKNGQIYHLLLLSLSFICFIVFSGLTQASLAYWLFMLAMPMAIQHGMTVWQATTPDTIRPLLAQVVKLAIITNTCFILPYWF